MNSTFGQGGFGIGTHITRIIIYAIQIETRIGHLDCDLSRQGDEQAEVLGCAFPDGSDVPEEKLVQLGLVEKPKNEKPKNKNKDQDSAKDQ